MRLVLDTEKMYRLRSYFSRQNREAVDTGNANGLWGGVLTQHDVTVTVDAFRACTLQQVHRIEVADAQNI